MKFLKARLKRAKKRFAILQNEIEQGHRWQEEAHCAELLQSNLYRIKKGMQEIEVEDWEQGGNKKLLRLDPLKEPADQLKRQWRLSQKLRNKLKYSIQFSEATVKEIEELEVLIAQETVQAQLHPDARVPQKKQEKTAAQPKPRSHPFREFKSAKGVSIFIGKGAANNEELTFSFAKGLDLWMHVANHSGCHVVLKAGKDVDEDSLLDALQLTLFFSKVQEDEITVAECKNLKKVKGAKKGLVQVGKHQTVFAKQDPERLEQIFARSRIDPLNR